MVSDSDKQSSKDVVEMVVPPISDPVPDSLLNQETGELLTTEVASFAREQSGICGGIGVGLEIVSTLLDDLRAFDERGTRPGELRHHTEMLAELEQVLVETADTEIDSYDKPLYDVEEEDEQNDPGETNDNSDTQYPQSTFKLAYLDRISSSNNLIAIPRDDSFTHCHVSAGIIGEECVLYDPTESFVSRDIPEKPIALPFSDVDEAQRFLRNNESIPVREGELIQLPSKPDNGDILELSGRDVEGIKIIGENERQYSSVARVTEIRDGIAFGEIVSKKKLATEENIEDKTRPDWLKEIMEKRDRQKRKRKMRKRKRRKKSKRNRYNTNSSSDHSDPNNLNKLLNGKL